MQKEMGATAPQERAETDEQHPRSLNEALEILEPVPNQFV